MTAFDHPSIARDELHMLRQELWLRIALQNLLLILAVALFAVAAMLAIGLPQSAGPIGLAQNLATGMLAVQWCHHGVRTMQIKTYIVAAERSRAVTWESWLPAHRPKRLLGTRWMISTKGVFLVAMAAMPALAAGSATSVPWLAAMAVATACIAILLFTNPKE